MRYFQTLIYAHTFICGESHQRLSQFPCSPDFLITSSISSYEKFFLANSSDKECLLPGTNILNTTSNAHYLPLNCRPNVELSNCSQHKNHKYNLSGRPNVTDGNGPFSSTFLVLIQPKDGSDQELVLSGDVAEGLYDQ